MRVLYVSKAMIAAAYRDKLRALAGHVELRAVVPERWGRHRVDPPGAGEEWLRTAPVRAHGRNHFHVYRGVGRMLRESEFDLVHVDEEPYSAVTAQLAHHCRSGRRPFVFFAWQNLPKRIPAPFRALRRYVFARAAGGIAGTDAAAAVLRGWGFAGPLAVIPQMGFDACRFRPDSAARAATRETLALRDTDFVVGFAGRLVRDKGVHVLLEAFAALAGAHLLLIGTGPERDPLLRDAARAGIADRVHLAGEVASSAMPGLLAACDVVVLPSLTARNWAEQFGRVLVESMACGVAVVGSDSGEIPAVIGDAGIVTPEGDAAALRAALIHLASTPADRATLGERGRRRALERFTNAGIAGRTAAFYRDIVYGEPQ
jgi:glycosyltransferase involved in cell wall biosynthesis